MSKEEKQKEVLRKDVKEKDKWKVESVYPSKEKFMDDLLKARNLMEKIDEFNKKYQNNLHKLSDKDFVTFFDEYYSFDRFLSKVYMYANLKKDEDVGNDENNSYFKMIKQVYNDFSAKVSWIDPEIVEIKQERIDELLISKEFNKYRLTFEKIVRMKKHTCSKEVEKVMALSFNVTGQMRSIFSKLSDSDLKFGMIKDEDGKEHLLTHGSFGLFSRSRDRTLRKNAFSKLHSKYKKYQNTICEIYNGVVQKNIFECKVRNYKSSLEKSLFSKKIPLEVYKNLVAATREGIGALHEYVKLRKEILKLDELHLYDLYVPLIDSNLKESYTFDEAVDLCIEACAPLGKEYQNRLKKGFLEERWMDRYENKGKRSGGYSSGHYDTFPFILLNFKGLLDDVFTMAHEGGHSMHSFLSNKNQQYHLSDYPIFVAEVASTFNENNLSDLLLQKVKSKEEKLHLLNKEIEDIRTTFFRQVLFAEFELRIHEMLEKKVPITPSILNKYYVELYKFYYGDDIVVDDFIMGEWSRIPHFFYYPFYVYQYATGLTCSKYLSDKVRKGGDKEREDYLNFLKAGSSEYPVELLKKAGIDLTKKEAFVGVTKMFKAKVEEFKKLYFEKE